MNNFDPFGSFEELEEALDRLGKDRREIVRFYAFTAILLAIALVCHVLQAAG
jgi:hypothetical protein